MVGVRSVYVGMQNNGSFQLQIRELTHDMEWCAWV